MATNADAQIRVTANTQDAVSQLNNLTNSAKQLNEAIGGLRKNSGKNAFSKELEDLKNFSREYGKMREQLAQDINLNNMTRSLKEQADAYEKLNAQQAKYQRNKKASTDEEVRSIRQLAERELQFEGILKRKEAAYRASSKSFDDAMQKYEKSLAAQQQYENALASREQITTSGFLKRIQNSAAYIAGYAGFNAITSSLTDGLNAIKEYELGITDLKRTIDRTGLTDAQFEASINNFGRSAIEQAKEFGVTITEVQSAMTELARAGVDSGSLKGMTETVLMGLNTTELKSAEEVTSSLVSTIKQLGMSWEDSGMILDSWNFLADRYAVQTDDFAHAIERSGSASKMLGMDLYDLNAVVTILGESTQASGEQVGTAFRSLSARLLRDSTIEKLEGYGIQVKKDADTFLDFQSIMENINEVIKDLPDDSPILSDIMDTLGGAWRKNWITALTQDFDRFDELVREQADSIGYSTEENAKAMDTIAKKTESLKQTFLEAFIDIGEEGGVKEGIKSLLDGTQKALETTINSPALRSVLDLLFGNPAQAIGLTALSGVFTKLNDGISPLQQLAKIVVGKVPQDGNTFGTWLNNMYQASGVSGKQNRATRLYSDLKKAYDLTDTEMLPLAERIDGVFNSNTKSMAEQGSELERLSAAAKDAKLSYDKLLSAQGREDFNKAFDLTDEERIANQVGLLELSEDELRNHERRKTDIYEKELERRASLVIEAQADYEKANKRFQANANVSKNERGIFGRLGAERFKENIRGMVGGLASMGVQMLAIGAAAKGIDYLLNRNKNAQRDFDDAIKSYEEQQALYRDQQKVIENTRQTMKAKGSLVSSDLTNNGLSGADYHSFLEQLEQLKSIAPEVADAIEQNARQVGNYGNAAEVAAGKLRELNQAAALTAFNEANKEYDKNMEEWSSTERKDYAPLYSLQAENMVDFYKSHGLVGKINKDREYDQMILDSQTDHLSNIQKMLSMQGEIRSELKSKNPKMTDKEIDGYFSALSESQTAISSAIADNRSLVGSMIKSIDTTQPKYIEQNIKSLDTVQSSLEQLAGSAQSVKQSETIKGFVDHLRTNFEALGDYNTFMTEMSDGLSSESISQATGRISDYIDEAVKSGAITAKEGKSISSALFSQYFGMTQKEYNQVLSNTKERVDNFKVDLKKVFGKNNIEDLTADQFKGISDVLNQIALNGTGKNGELTQVGKKIRDSINQGLFDDADLSKLSLDNFFKLDSSKVDSVLAAFTAMKKGSEGLGLYLKNGFQGDMSEAFNHLSNIAMQGSDGFTTAIQGMFNNMQGLTLEAKANMINDLASLFDIKLNNNMLEPFKLEIDPDTDSIIPKIEEATGGENFKVKLKTEVDKEQLKQETKEAADAANDAVENTPPAKLPAPESNTEGAAAAGEEASGAYNNEVENGTPPKAPAPEVTEPEPVKIPTELEIEEGTAKGLVNQLETLPVKAKLEPEVEESSLNDIFGKVLDFNKGDNKINFKVSAEDADDAINRISKKDIKVNVKANTEALESKLDSIGEDKTVKVNVEANTSKTDNFLARIESKDVDVEVNVNANTSDAESQIERLGGRHRSVDVDVEANIGDAIREVNSLGDVTPHVDVAVTADVSEATSAISSLGDKHEVSVTIDADTSGATSAISTLLSSARTGLSGLSAQAGALASKVSTIATQATSASSTLTNIIAQASAAQVAVASLQATASQPIAFNIDASMLQQLPGQVQNANSAASAAMDSMINKINATAQAFQAGCSQMVSAWASMSFPAPHIPMPTVSVSSGVGSYSASISWHAKGGIVPATPGGRIVGVAEGGQDEAIIPLPKLKEYIKETMTDVADDAMDDFGTKKKESREAPPEITVMSATTISEAIQRSMTHVLEDAMKDYSDLMKESWASFSHDYNMSTTNGYYANKIDTPYLELDPEAKDALKQFVNTKIEIKGWDVKDASYIKQYIMQDSSRLQKLSDEMKQQVEYYETIGDSIGKANAETELMILMQKQSNALRQDANELARELATLEKEKGEDFSKYLDANLELNYLYAKQVATFGEGNSEAKEAFENGVKAYQELAKALDEAKKTMKELAIEMDKQIHKLATEYLENSINKGYDSQRDYYQDRLDRLDREQEQYEKDIEEQRKKLEKAKKDFDNDIQAKIDKIKDEQEKREDEEKLKKLQDKIKDAEDRLNGLKNEYDTKVYSIDENGEWQFSYEANPEELEEAVEDLEEAQEDLKEYYEDKEIDRLEKERENYEKQYDMMIEALEEQQEMRLEQYDQEREALEKHLEQVEDMREQALEQLDKLAYQFVERLKSMFRYDLGKVNDYLNTMNGNANVQSYNPLSELVPTKYAQQLAATGVNLEKYTNELLEITRNAGKYDPQAVQKAISELKKLGTTGAIDLGSSIKMNPQLQHALDKLGTSSINDLIFHNLNRIGEIRGEAFGDKQGTVVTAHDMAKYFKYLGIETSAIQLSQLKDKIAKQELDWKGNPLIDVFDRMENFGTNIDFGETGQGLLNDSAWKDLMGTIMGFDGTAQNIYDITGQLITNSEEDLALGDNVILALMGNNKFLESLMGQNKEYYDKVSQFFTDIIGKMDANEFFNSADGFMNKHLEYALQGSSDVNKFIIETLQRIGSQREDGSEVTSNDVFKYFDKLGINGKLVLNTIKSTTGLSDATNNNNLLLDKNGNIIGLNTEYTGTLNKTNLELLSASLKNIASQNGLTAEIEGLPDDFKEILTNFSNIIDQIVAGMKDNTPSEDEIQNNLQAAADALNAAFGRGGDKETLDAQKQQTKSLQENTQTISVDTYASNNLNKTNAGLDKTTETNNKGQEALNSTIVKSTGDIRSTVNTFTARLGEYIASVKQTALRAESAADKAERAANRAESAASAAQSAASAAQSAANAAKNPGGGGGSNNLQAAADALNAALGKKPNKVVSVARPVKKYADGGIVDYTGLANVHGTPNSPEVVFNATDAKKLYNLVRSIDLTTANLPHLSPINLAPYVASFMSNKNSGESVNIDNITMEFPQVNDPDGVKKAILDLGRNIKLYT